MQPWRTGTRQWDNTRQFFGLKILDEFDVIPSDRSASKFQLEEHHPSYPGIFELPNTASGQPRATRCGKTTCGCGCDW